MLVNAQTLDSMYIAFKTIFNEASKKTPTFYRQISMESPSTAREETCAWLGEFSRIREWVGSRVIRNLAAHSYSIKNKTFEDTIRVARTDIEDDRIGIFKPMISEMGRAATTHPDELVFALLAAGFETLCYDGQNFFDADHPVIQMNDSEASVSNMQSGSSTPWYLLDCSREIKPLIWQPRLPYEFGSMTQNNDPNVFMNDEYLYGVRARANVGFGFWQMAFGSKATLDAENYEAARAAMAAFKGDNGKPLGIKGTHLIVPPELEGAGRRLVVNTVNAEGGSNEWAGSAELIVSPWLA